MTRRILLPAAVILLSFALLTVIAAPIMPPRLEVDGAVRSLAGLTRLVLDIGTLPPPLRKEGVTDKKLRRTWRRKLADAGIEVVDADAPKLALRVHHLVNRDVPDAAGLLALLTLTQEVSIPRLDERVMLPSYTEYAVGIDAGDKIGPSFGPIILGMVDGFIAKVRRATVAHTRRRAAKARP